MKATITTFTQLLTALSITCHSLATSPPAEITAPPSLHGRAYEPGDDSFSCFFFNSRLRSCASTDDASTIPNPATLFGCLCYNDSLFIPWVFDDGLQTCLSYLSTASTSMYSTLGPSLTPFTSLCAMIASVDGTSSWTGYSGTGAATVVVVSSQPGGKSSASAVVVSPQPGGKSSASAVVLSSQPSAAATTTITTAASSSSFLPAATVKNGAHRLERPAKKSILFVAMVSLFVLML